MGLDLRLAFTIIAKPCGFEHTRKTVLVHASVQIVDHLYMPKLGDGKSVCREKRLFPKTILDSVQYIAAWMNIDKPRGGFDGRRRHIFKLKRDNIHPVGKCRHGVKV